MTAYPSAAAFVVKSFVAAPATHRALSTASTSFAPITSALLVASPPTRHPDATTTTALRMGAVSTAVTLKDFTSAATGYFGSVRIPASFIAGSSLGAIFTLKKFWDNMDSRSGLERFLVKLYHALAVLSFILSLNTVITATAAGTAILHGRFEPMAETAYMLMKREFEYEFVTTRWSFLVSIMMFIVGVTTRIFLEFDLLQRDKRSAAFAVFFSMAALVSHLLSFINSTLYCWPNLFFMTCDVCKMIVTRALSQHHPMQMISLVSAGLGAIFTVRLTLESRARWPQRLLSSLGIGKIEAKAAKE